MTAPSMSAELVLLAATAGAATGSRALLYLLDADVSGRDLPRRKPDPMIFLVAQPWLPEEG